MGRLKPELMERAEEFSHRVVDVAEAIEKQGRSRRIIDQMIGSGTSVGANVCESDEALSRPDFCKGLAIALKELGEIRYWPRFVSRRGWIEADRLTPLHTEAHELKLILGSIVSKTKANASNAAPKNRPSH